MKNNKVDIQNKHRMMARELGEIMLPVIVFGTPESSTSLYTSKAFFSDIDRLLGSLNGGSFRPQPGTWFVTHCCK